MRGELIATGCPALRAPLERLASVYCGIGIGIGIGIGTAQDTAVHRN
ncbi:hypothetical protein [Nocardia sp. XZ_19_369]|nr:hypothetical protein [Nocardia sp. XZ_19_369]